MKHLEKKDQFIIIPYYLSSSIKLNSTEKQFIGYILGWQMNKKACYESSQSIANKLGLKVESIRSLMKRLKKKYDFFSVDQTTFTNHELKIDEEKLKLFLKSKIEEESIQQEIIQSEPLDVIKSDLKNVEPIVVSSIVEDEKVDKIEDNDLKRRLINEGIKIQDVNLLFDIISEQKMTDEEEIQHLIRDYKKLNVNITIETGSNSNEEELIEEYNTPIKN